MSSILVYRTITGTEGTEGTEGTDGFEGIKGTEGIIYVLPVVKSRLPVHFCYRTDWTQLNLSDCWYSGDSD
jgi:hypothetical protein